MAHVTKQFPAKATPDAKSGKLCACRMSAMSHTTVKRANRAPICCARIRTLPKARWIPICVARVAAIVGVIVPAGTVLVELEPK